MLGLAGMLLATGLVAHAQEGVENKVDELRRDAESWIEEARDVYRLDCESMQQLWDVFCGADWEPNEAPDRDSAYAKASELKDRQVQKIEALLEQYGKLKSRAEDLKQDKTRDKAEQVLGEMKKEYDRIGKLKDKGAWRGSSHPLVQSAIEHGKDRHRSMESASSFGCLVKDKPFPGADGRPDCVSADKCTVYEFKPKNDRAERMGRAQLDRYVPAVERYFQELINTRKLPDSDYGGREILFKIAARCMNGASVRFSKEVATYDMCRKEYECIQ